MKQTPTNCGKFEDEPGMRGHCKNCGGTYHEHYSGKVAVNAPVHPLATYTNAENGMTSFVVANSKAGFNVTLRDDDSGEFVPLAICGIDTLDAAKAKALEAVK